ncbi:hypothetical protein JW935_21735 [candidate division KSB1 bacterium]|nr:hypothetical protein [candidate division KSB1 bacterium]
MKNKSILPVLFFYCIGLLFFTWPALTKDFPIGAYFVQNEGGPEGFIERPEYYWQVAQCGINIITGGNRGNLVLADVLDEA